MKALKRALLALFAAFAIIASPLSLAAHAGDPVIDTAKDQGLVGENISGYLAVVGSVEPAVKRKVDEINALRREVYDKLAKEKGQSLATIARLSGEKLVANETSGHLVFDDSESWVKVP